MMTRLVQHKDLKVIVWNDLVFCLHPWLVLPTADSFIWISLVPDENLRLGFDIYVQINSEISSYVQGAQEFKILFKILHN